MKRGPVPLPAEFRFWMLVDIIDDADSCWMYCGSVGSDNRSGYGSFKNEHNKNEGAHRFSYRAHNELDAIEPGLHVCHKCDMPTCVRPSHLFLGTRKDNQRDSRNKGRGYTPSFAGRKHDLATRLKMGKAISEAKRNKHSKDFT